MANNEQIILASTSPRRKYLLEMILSNFGLKFDIIPANIKEYIPEKVKNYGDLVKKLAIKKAELVAKDNDGIIIGADTIVVLEDKVMGKPVSAMEAKLMLRKLSGRQHKVYSGISVINSTSKTRVIDYEVTSVFFRTLKEDEINFYVESGSPMDKAGAYGIQDDFGSTFVEKINGDYFNVVGLPVVKTYLALKQIMKINL
jgi:septum formation protein